MAPDELFLSRLDLIDRVIGSVCRRNACYGAEAEDFAQEAKLKLIEDDYSILRKFEGRSRLSTYLTAVIHNQFRDFRIARWGKWRPSAAARRGGPVAVQLETLLYRDDRSLDEAVEILRSNFKVENSRQELVQMAAVLPARTKRRIGGEDGLEGIGSDHDVERRVENKEKAATVAKVEEALAAAMAGLQAQNRLLLKMRFLDGLTVAQISRGLHLNQRSLYSRFDKCRRELKNHLEQRGVTSDDVTSILGWEGSELKIHLSETTENAATGPSN